MWKEHGTKKRRFCGLLKRLRSTCQLYKNQRGLEIDGSLRKWYYKSEVNSCTGKNIWNWCWCMEEEQRRHKKETEWNLWKFELKRNITWQICMNFFDLDLNLQWFAWSKTYWFDWLTKWLIVNINCPNCRTKLDKNNIPSN